MADKHTFTARVIKGSGKGKIMGFPTLNLNLADVPDDMDEGIYAVRVQCHLEVVRGMTDTLPAAMHYGERPVHHLPKSCEVHVIDTVIDTAPNSVEVTIIKRLRDIQTFDSEEELKKQIMEDIRNTNNICYTSRMSDLLTRAVENIIPRKLAEQKIASGKSLRVYLGIDPTGAKLHIGHSVQLRKLKAFANAGHHVIFLVGSFTAMIGDPSGRDKQREQLTRKQVEENFYTYKDQASKILDFEKDVEVRYNHEWLESLSQKDMLKISSCFTKQQMEQREMFVRREKSGQPIHMFEFLYPMYVGYDSVALDVDCEIGGSDQEFNMLCGRTLQKAYGKREKFIITNKIINGLDGRKMSKTYDNCVYLDDEPNDMFGKLMSVNDELMETYFECCTDIPMSEVSEILNGNPRDAKAHLAREIVTLYHGEKKSKVAEGEFNSVFKEKGIPDDIAEVKVEKGSALIDILVDQKLVSSKGEARRLIEQKGIKMNDKVVDSIDQKIEEGITKVGKRKFLRIIFS